MKRISSRVTALVLVVSAVLVFCPAGTAQESAQEPVSRHVPVNEVLDWNQIFIDTLVATSTANSSSQRLGAIVHTAVFDAYNGVDRRYTPIFVHDTAPLGASRRAAVVGAAHTALVGLFPARQAALDASYAESVAALTERCERGGHPDLLQQWFEARLERGLVWGVEVAQSLVGARRWIQHGPAAVHRRTRGRPMAADAARLRPMSAQGLAFTQMFVLPKRSSILDRRADWAPSPTPKISNTVKALGPRPDLTRAQKTKVRSRCSGRATRACTGTRPPTRSLAPTICRCRTATVCSC